MQMLFGTGYYNTATAYRGQGKGQTIHADVAKITFRSVKEAGNKYHPGYFVVVLKSGGRYALARGVSPPQFESYFKNNALEGETNRLKKIRQKEEKALAPPSGARKLMNAVSSALCGGRPC